MASPLDEITKAIIAAIDTDNQIAQALKEFGLDADAIPTDDQLKTVSAAMVKEAIAPLASNAKLRLVLQEVRAQTEQLIDEVSKDVLIEAAPTKEGTDKARELVQNFEKFIAENKDEITALQFFYSHPYRARLRYEDIKKLADAI